MKFDLHEKFKHGKKNYDVAQMMLNDDQLCGFLVNMVKTQILKS